MLDKKHRKILKTNWLHIISKMPKRNKPGGMAQSTIRMYYPVVVYDEFWMKQQVLLATAMATITDALTGHVSWSCPTGRLIIQRKIKIKTLFYKFSFETSMTELAC